GRPPEKDNKFTSKYIDVHWSPLYPFGHGLGYTTFEYGEPTVERARVPLDDPRQVVRVRVTNTGPRAGTEVVQLYLRDDVASVTRPVRELRGFQRVELQPGESREVEFTLGFEDLALYDARMRRVVEPGTFTVFAGGSSAAVQSARFEVVARCTRSRSAWKEAGHERHDQGRRAPGQRVGGHRLARAQRPPERGRGGAPAGVR